MRRPVELDKTKFNVAVVSTASYDEPIAEIFKAARELPNVAFHVTGNYKNREHIVQSAPGNVRFTGYVPDDAFYGLTPQPQEPPLLLSVGRLVEKKGSDYLIRACRRLKDAGRTFVCHIIGSGPDRPKLEALIAELGLQETVALRGVLPHDQVMEEYNRATLFALPCIQGHDGSLDGIPNVLPEAMASWLPVVSTPVSAIPELIQDQQNGVLVPPEDDAALVAALAQLLDDADLRQRLSVQGRQAVKENFDLDKNVRAVYNSRFMWV